MRTTLRYILLTAIRDRLFVGAFLGILFSTLLSYFLGSTALVESAEMSVSFAAASARIILDTGLILFACFHLRRGFEHKEIDVMLSRPISRTAFVLSYWMGLAVVATLLVTPAVLLVGILGGIYSSGFFFWGLSLLVEAWLLVALALFIGLILQSAVSAVMACLGFYVLSRMMAFFVLMTANRQIIIPDFSLLNQLAKWGLQALSVLFPRLDLFGKSEWIIYGIPQADMQAHWLFLMQGGIYIALLLSACIFDFRRKQF